MAEGKNEGDVGLDSFLGKNFHGLEALGSGGNFHENIFVPFCGAATFGEHSGKFSGDDFGADGAVDDFRDFFDAFFEGDAFFCDEARVCGDTVKDAPGCVFFDVVEVRGVEKKLHKEEVRVRVYCRAIFAKAQFLL